MFARIGKCLMAWVVGIVFLILPLHFIYPEFIWGNEIWRILLSLFIIYFPGLLLFEFFFQQLIRNSVLKQNGLLALMFILSGLEIYALPFKLCRLNADFNYISFAIMSFFSLLAAVAASQVFRFKMNLIIVQKEI